MSYEWLLSFIQQFGYVALFFALWLGIVGMPIPDEVIVMTGGAVTAGGVLHTFPAFIATYLGVVSGLSVGYVLGRWFGTAALDRLRRKKKFGRYIDFSEKLMQKYGSFALCIGYFFPIIRHVMPYAVGINKMTFKRYALFSYTTGLIWTILFFALGRLVGEQVRHVGYLVYQIGLKSLWAPFTIAAVFAIWHFTRKSKGRDKLWP